MKTMPTSQLVRAPDMRQAAYTFVNTCNMHLDCLYSSIKMHTFHGPKMILQAKSYLLPTLEMYFH